jgi:LETM1 and EF-hand domain-containing protein 1, mitochondrial
MAARIQVSRSCAASKRIMQQFHPRLATNPVFHTVAPRRRFNRSDLEVSALAIALPRRTYATETSTSQGSGGDGPPPGFDINEAKKPLAREENKEAKKAAPTIEELKNDVSLATPSATKPSELAPTSSAINASLSELAAQKQKSEEKDSKVAKAEEKKKLTLGQRIMKEVHHYWDGYVQHDAEFRPY